MEPALVEKAAVHPAPLAGRILLLLLSVALYTLCFPPFGLWPLAFFALAPALVATCGLDPWPAGKWGAAFGFCVGASGVTWFWNLFASAAVPMWAILGVWVGVFFAGRAILDRGFGPRASFWLIVALWVAVEFFRAEGYYLRCSFLSLGHALAAEGCFLRTAARWAGAYGMGGFLFAVNLAAARALRPGPGERRTMQCATGAIVALALALIAGSVWALFGGTAQGPKRTITLVQSETGSVRQLVDMSREHEGAVDFILWPEVSVPVDIKANAPLRDQVAALAREKNAFVGVGAKLNHPTAADNFLNAYLLFSPKGDIVGEYHKMLPVQFMKDGVPGRELGLCDTPRGTLGIAICYDADFSWIPRNLASRGAHLIAVPTYDAEFWGERMRRQHVAASVLRAIENGRWVARPASSGPSLIVDPMGRIVQRIDGPAPGAVTGEARLATGRTFYNRVGWLIPYLAQGVCVIALFAVAVRPHRRRTAKRSPQAAPNFPSRERSGRDPVDSRQREAPSQ